MIRHDVSLVMRALARGFRNPRVMGGVTVMTTSPKWSSL